VVNYGDDRGKLSPYDIPVGQLSAFQLQCPELPHCRTSTNVIRLKAGLMGPVRPRVQAILAQGCAGFRFHLFSTFLIKQGACLC
jgi:hypothetical protein